jgi:hypothetical protein
LVGGFHSRKVLDREIVERYLFSLYALVISAKEIDRVALVMGGLSAACVHAIVVSELTGAAVGGGVILPT